MSMLEKMARQLAMDALNRVQVDTYTNVVDEIWLYRTGNATYRVSDYPGISNEGTPVLTFADACEAMVAMMAEQAGALVVVPEDAPMDSHLAQIAQLLVDSADVDTDAQDVADGAAIVRTVKRAMDWLTKARHDNSAKHARIVQIEGLNESLQDELKRRDDRVTEWQTKAVVVQGKLNDAQRSVGQLEAVAEREKRNALRWEAESHEWQARYEGMEAALRIVLELAGVGK